MKTGEMKEIYLDEDTKKYKIKCLRNTRTFWVNNLLFYIKTLKLI